MEERIGFIGCGNMAKAMIEGLLAHGTVPAAQIMASARTEESVRRAAEAFGIETTTNNRVVASFADILVLAVKPQFMDAVLAEIRDCIRAEQVLVTLAPGKTHAHITDMLCGAHKVVRTMPNTPALVGEAMSALCPNEAVSPEELLSVRALFNSFGRTEVVAEPLIDVVTGVSGSAPAYAFLFIEALADAAVRDGMPRAKAYTFAAQALLGSAKLVLESGKHPGELKDMVCSPGGTTIEAVRVLEERGFRSAVMEAALACTQKARQL